MATLNGSAVQRARVYLPGYGIWSARVSLAGPSSLGAGARAELVIGDLALSGAIRRGGTFVGETSYLVVGGADGWRRVAPRRDPYRADNGVRLAQVAGDLAGDVGEAVRIEPGLPKFIGAAWSRDVQQAFLLLADVCRRVNARAWMTPNGVTHIGPARAVTSIPRGLAFAVERHDPAGERATLAVPDDRIAAFQPGLRLVAPGVDPFVVSSVTVELEPGRVVVHVDGRDAAGMMGAILDTRAGARLSAVYLYQVREQPAGSSRISLRAIETVAGLPDQLLIDKAHGIAGASEVCAPGSSVLVGFRGGSPAAPFVASYLPGTAPVTATLNAQTTLTLGGPSAAPLAQAAQVEANLATLAAAISDVATNAMVAVPIMTMQATATTKVRGE